jgi:hypothetical protein
MKRKITIGLVALAAMLGLFVIQPGSVSVADNKPGGNPVVQVIHLMTPQRAEAVACASGYICGFPCSATSACGFYYQVSQTVALNQPISLHLNSGDDIYSVHNNNGHQWRVYHYDLFHGGCGSASALIYANTKGNMNTEWRLQHCIMRVS